MKKTCFLTLIAATLLWMLPSCKPVEDPSQQTDQVVVATAEPTYVSAYSATCSAEVTAPNPGLLTEIGVCWSTSANPTVDNFVKKSNKCSKPFSAQLSNLEPNTQYHVRGFAKYGLDYCYGSEKTFTTLDPDTPGASPITTPEATDITYNSFGCHITVEPIGLSNWYLGVCYSQLPEFTYGDAEGSALSEYYIEDGVYKADIYCYDLIPNTQYYYRAFIFYRDEYTNEYNFYYGDILSFATLEVPFVLEVNTYSPDYYWGNYMIAYGGGYCTMPQLINQLGFCYSNTNAYPQYDSDLHTIAASPTGQDMYFDFSSYINILSANSKYYVRSYVRYKTDSIKYGNVVSVDTYK